MDIIGKVVNLFRAKTTPGAAYVAGDTYIEPRCDVNGNLFTSVISGVLPITAREWSNASINLTTTYGLDTNSYLYGLDPGAPVNKGKPLQIVWDDTDSTILAGGLLGVMARLQAYNPITDSFYRVQIKEDNLDAVAATATGNLAIKSHNGIFNEVTWDRLRSASASVQALATKIGVLAVAKIGDWSVHSDPAAATQATITRAAGAAGVRHICTSISATFSAGATAGAAVKVYLRDGITGAGAILWSGSLAVPIGGSQNIVISDLSIVGLAATAMTLEFAAAGAAGTFQNVSLTGYDTI